MKARLLLVSMFAILASGLTAQEPTLEEVLKKHYLAGNFARLSQVNTIIMTGTIVQQDLMPVKITRVRPDKYMMEFDVADLTAYQVFDGQEAWITTPWTGDPAPKAAPDRVTDFQTRADIEGILFNWKEKGHTVELAGTDTLNGLLLHKIKVTRKDGGIEYHFIDASGFMLQKRIYYRKAGGKEITVESHYRDYRKVNGIPFAFVVETNNGGRVNEIQFDAVELDKPVDLKLFTMPGKKP